MRIIIIGAGVIGGAFAYHLSRQGAEVIVLEQASPASGASGKSFGWLNDHYPESADYHALRMAALREHRELATDSITQWHGSLWWEQEGETIDQHLATLQEYNYPAEILNADQVREKVPNLARVPESAIYSDIEGAVDPGDLTGYFMDQARNANATLICGTKAVVIEGSSSDGFVVKTSSGRFQADRVVVAAGVGTSTVTEQLGISLPQRYRQGLIVRTQPVAETIGPILLTPDAHFRQDQEARLLIGEDFGGGKVSGNPDELARKLCSAVHGYFPELAPLSIDQVTVGIRPEPRDGLPVLGYPDTWHGIYLACLHSGATLAPLVAKLGSREILEDVRLPELDAYRIERFARTMGLPGGL